jgi:hypothetical protein
MNEDNETEKCICGHSRSLHSEEGEGACTEEECIEGKRCWECDDPHSMKCKIFVKYDPHWKFERGKRDDTVSIGVFQTRTIGSYLVMSKRVANQLKGFLMSKKVKTLEIAEE